MGNITNPERNAVFILLRRQGTITGHPRAAQTKRDMRVASLILNQRTCKIKVQRDQHSQTYKGASCMVDSTNIRSSSHHSHLALSLPLTHSAYSPHLTMSSSAPTTPPSSPSSTSSSENSSAAGQKRPCPEEELTAAGRAKRWRPPSPGFWHLISFPQRMPRCP